MRSVNISALLIVWYLLYFLYIFSQVGADGANSIVRQQMGVNNFTLNYNQMGLIATVELDEVYIQ